MIYTFFLYSGKMEIASNIDLSEFSFLLETAVRNPKRLKNLFASKMLSTSNGFTIRIHILRSDGNDRPDVGNLVQTLAASTLEYCIPRRQILDAQKKQKRDNSHLELMILHNKAREMFNDLKQSGEGGELLLFLLSETVLGYPQLVSKMSLKTSHKIHYQGLDGIFVSVSSDTKKLRLHFGESKLHKSFAGSIRECIESISPFLKDQGCMDKGNRDLYIVNTYPDLGDETLTTAFKNFLDPSHEDYQSPEACAVLLAGFNVDNYPVLRANKEIDKEILDSINLNLTAIDQRISNAGIEQFYMDFFLLPFPCIDDFRAKLRSILGFS